jgi:hypothetical protein
LTVCFAWAIIGSASARDDPAGPTPTITLRVLNYAEVPEKTLIQAEREVTKIFRKIGVESRWRHISLSPEHNPAGSVGEAPSLSLELSILIISRSAAEPMEERLDLKEEVLGLSPRPKEGRGGRLAYVFHHRVREYVIKRKLFEQEALVLGLAIAHEIGHLLLPHDSHSHGGIMRARWDRQDLRLATFGDLAFTPQQADSIRAEVTRRMARIIPAFRELGLLQGTRSQPLSTIRQ